MRRITLLLVALFALATSACGPKYQTVSYPPRVDLSRHQMIGVIEFSSSSEEELARLATRRFTESARRDQGLVRMIDLGTVEDAKAAVGQDGWNPETFQAIGRELNVQTILTGELKISDAKPRVNIGAALRSGSVNAEIDVVLDCIG